MVISSNFVVIRTESGLLLPEYLFWLLNTQNMKRKIYENATSNMLGSVKATFLMDLELTVLPLEHQRRIARLNLLAKKEERLLKELADEKEKLYDILLNQAYKSAKKGNEHDHQKRYRASPVERLRQLPRKESTVPATKIIFSPCCS